MAEPSFAEGNNGEIDVEAYPERARATQYVALIMERESTVEANQEVANGCYGFHSMKRFGSRPKEKPVYI